MILVSHRTPRSAEACLELEAAGANLFEVDVQLGRDGLVVSHFLPVLWVSGWLDNDHWRLRWRGGTLPDPSLDEVLSLIPAGCEVLLDPKEDRGPRKRSLRERLIAAIGDPGRFVVSTRHLDDLDEFRAAGFRTWRTIGSRTALRTAARDGRLAYSGVSIRHTLVTPESAAWLSGRVETVVAWTVNDPARARALVSTGVSGVTTDNPAVLAALRPGDQCGAAPSA